MADAEQLAEIVKSARAWNVWRFKNPDVARDLRGADLSSLDLREVDLSKVDLRGANLSWANLSKADLREADLREADLSGADLTGTNFTMADLTGAYLTSAGLTAADLIGADLTGAHLRGVNLRGADLSEANLTGADLSVANLTGTNFTMADLTGAHLRWANLTTAILVQTDFTGADLTGCKIYGISAWGLKLSEETTQKDLVITPRKGLIITRYDEPEITVDNIEVAQFVYLLLHNPKIREVIDTIGQKAVLILGRFTEERKKVLDDIREELRKHNYVPILFDFDKPAGQDLTATVSTLAHMAKFIIADLTDPSSTPYELATVVPTTPVPVQPILLTDQREFAMFPDLQRRYHWVLAPHCYDTLDHLLADLAEWVIGPAEAKAEELRKELKVQDMRGMKPTVP